jgi:hypothetical protein
MISASATMNGRRFPGRSRTTEPGGGGGAIGVVGSGRSP